MTGVNRPLSDGEHRVMYDLATGVVAEQTGSDIATAKEALGNFAAKGELNIRGDTENAYVEVSGRVLVHANRGWLVLHSRLMGVDQRVLDGDVGSRAGG